MAKNEASFAEVEARLNGILNKIEMQKRLKEELVTLGIAEDSGGWNVIRVKPDKFKDYAKYLREHPNARI